jgi:hypothetical protein
MSNDVGRRKTGVPNLSRHADTEAGAILPISALVLVVLMVFAALSVDLGAAWGQRTLNQTAVDGGVMAGAIGYVDDPPDINEGVVATIEDFVDRNLGYKISNLPALGGGEWATCVDPEVDGVNYVALTYPPALGGGVINPCISLSGGVTPGSQRYLRVYLPTQEVDTSFARVIGINSIATGAFAEAELDFSLEGGALPFVLPSSPGVQSCLGTPPAGLADDPCTGPGTGKFGVINSDFHGSDDTLTCLTPPPPSVGMKLGTNLALGLDHFVTTADEFANPLDGEDSCNALTVPYIPYALIFDPGAISSLQEGLAGDSQFGIVSNMPGRLRQGGGINGSIAGLTAGSTPLVPADVVREVPDGVGDIYLDNVGLWEYLTNTGNPANKCDRNHVDYANGGSTATDQLEVCLTPGGFGPGPVFIDEIATSPRFALVPELWINEAALDVAVPGTRVNIQSFLPVYLQAAFFNCNATECMVFSTYEDLDPLYPGSTPLDLSDDHMFFAPGEGDVVGCLIQNPIPPQTCKFNVNLSLDAITAWVLDSDWIPGFVFPGGPEEDKPVIVLLAR